MKAINSSLLLFLSVILFAQSGSGFRSHFELDANLAPFYHGVASGDPLPDAVIIWTRVTSEDASVTVTWKMATDTLFNNIINSGTATTGASRDYTINVDVTGLQPATYYYYQFELEGRKSLIGRTKTAPVGDNSHLRFAVVSCANIENGYYNAYEHIAYRNDIDAVLHLGDYIYELEIGGIAVSLPERASEPPHEIITLSDYRVRHSHYRLDPQLQRVHQQYPFIATWDDHETNDNAWVGGAGGHNPNSEGDWFVRKANGKRAYFEWLPVRVSTIDSSRIYRKFKYGDLADIVVLDTRLEGRDEQVGIFNQDTSRSILGRNQFNWFVNNLKDTTTRWKIVQQQVMMAPLTIGGIPFNDDQWDGYENERLKLFNKVIDNNVQNFVVLTGDIHSSWANELVIPGFNSVGVEFITTSITTTNLGVIGFGLNPAASIGHVKWANLDKSGYSILDITKDSVQTDFVFMNTIAEIDTSASIGGSWYVYDGERTLNEAQQGASGLINQAPLAPLTVNNPLVGIADNQDQLLLIGTYPNPFLEKFIVQFYLEKTENVSLTIVDLNGKTILKSHLGQRNNGLNYAEVSTPELAVGNYFLVLNNGTSTFQRSIIKVD